MTDDQVSKSGNVSIAEFPHAVFLFQRMDQGKYVNFFGGSVLTPLIILTAVHAAQHDPVEVYAGHEDLEKVQIRRTKKRHISHENYNSQTFANDIALVLLDAALPLGGNIQRVLITPRFPYAKVVRMASWGLTDYTAKQNQPYRFLQCLGHQVVRRYPPCRLEGTFCTKNIKPDRNTINQYDTGSAVIVGKNQQIGIANNILKKHDYPRLMVSVNVTYYYNWLKKTADRICNE